MAGETERYDLVIVGGGPAGSTAARRARRLGLTALIVDKARFPRPKLCGGGLTLRSRRAIEATFGTALPDDLVLASRRVAFKWNGELLSSFDAPYDLHYTMRPDFDTWLLRQAEAAGAEVREGTRVEAYDLAAGRLTLDGGREVAYGVLVGADGVASAVARLLFGRAFDPETIGFAYEAEAPGGCAAGAEMSIDFGAANWGYGWNFPKRGSRTIGVAGLNGETPEFRAAMDSYLRREGVDPAQVTTKGAYIPWGDFRREPGRGAVLLVGDAAGYADSLTGEGIAYALETGAEAAETAAEVLSRGTPDRAARVYTRRIGYVLKELDKSNRLRHFAYSRNFEALFREKLRSSQGLRETFFALINGEVSYDDVQRRVMRSMAKGAVGKVTGWPSRMIGRG